MPTNLEKVIKVTQAQYNILANGGTVGGYTGLDVNYIYLIQDDNDYLPTTGGSIINNGTVIFRNGNASSGERFELNGETHDDYSIIYLPHSGGQHLEDISLFGDNDGSIIYSIDDDYHSNIAINSDELVVVNYSGDGYDLTFNPDNHSIAHTYGNTVYTATLPNETGTIALQSYVQANPANPTTPLSSIQIGNTKYSVSSANYYPTAVSWTNGTTAGPTGTMTMSGTSNISIPAIPAATTTRSGVVTTANQDFAGVKGFYSYAVFYDRIYQGVDINTNNDGSTLYLMKDYINKRRAGKFTGFYANSSERNYFYGLAGNSLYLCKCNYKGNGTDAVSPASDGLWECWRANDDTNGRSGHLAQLFDSNFTNGPLFPVAGLSTKPVVITITKTDTNSIDATDVCYLVINGWRYDGIQPSGNPYYGTLNSYKVELLLKRADNNNLEWVKTFERTNVTDYIHGLAIPIWSNIAGVGEQYYPADSNSYKIFYGVRLTISAATAGTINNGCFGITDLKLMEARPAGIPADGVGAFPLVGGTVLGNIIISNKYSDWGLKTQSNNSGIIGASDGQFYAMYAQNYYENGTALSNKYLGKTAKAADADKLDGQDSIYYLNYNNLTNKPPVLNIENGAGTNSVQQKTIKVEEPNVASGYESIAFNHETQAVQKACAAFGGGTIAGDSSVQDAASTYGFAFAIGEQSKAKGRGSFSSGNSTEALNQYSATFGLGTKSSRDCELVAGTYNDVAATNMNKALFVVGNGTGTSSRHNALVVYENGIAELDNQGKTANSIVIYDTIPDLRKGTGARSVIQTHGAQANQASGQSAIALGMGNTATATRAVTIGEGLIGNVSNTTYVGKYNDNSINNTLFVVGNGTSTSARSNALEVYKDGHAEVGSMGSTNNSIATKQYVDNKSNLIETTWSNLKSLRDGGNLIPGMQYRITDYVCTTTTANTSSAGHVFDVIVTADTNSKLNENARACLHDGDTYFANNKLEAWKLKYCLDNDTTRFTWADTTNGKGVIYEMEDEFNNRCPYDFKNILMTKSGYCTNAYTFNYSDNSVYKDASISSDKSVKNNVIESPMGWGQHTIPFNIFFSSSSSASWIQNVLGRGCTNNLIYQGVCQLTMGTSCANNIIFNGCYYITFGTNCSYNYVGLSGGYSNAIVFGNNCSSNMVYRYSSYIRFGDSSGSNSVGENTYSTVFSNGCSGNSLGNGCNFVTFGSSSNYNTLGNYCTSISFGNSCGYIKLGTSSTTITNCKNIVFDNGCSYLYLDITGTSATSIQNVRLGPGITGSSSSNRRTIIADTSSSYQTTYEMTSSKKIILE